MDNTETIEKKSYSNPELIEWGSINDLTQGVLSGTADAPSKGGTGGG